MKTSTLLSLVFVIGVSSASAQKFTLLPQIGLQNPATKITYNNLPEIKPLQSQLNPSYGLRLDYKLKNGYGPYVGISSSRQTIAYSFTQPENGAYNYQATQGNMQVQLQAGFQATTKPIYFKKSAPVNKTITKPNTGTTYSKCGIYKNYNRGAMQSRETTVSKAQNKNLFVRIQPSVGVAYNPATPETINSKFHTSGNTATYLAGNSNTTLITGVGFEFANSVKRHLTVSLNYFKGLGNNTETITTDAGLKSINTQLQSAVSGWSATVGIPISIGKKPVVKKVETRKMEYKSNDNHPYKSKCRRSI